MSTGQPSSLDLDALDLNPKDLEGLTVVITGALPNLSRKQAQELVERSGGKVTRSISSKTNLLIAGDKAGSKLKKAEELGVEVLDEDGLLKYISSQSNLSENTCLRPLMWNVADGVPPKESELTCKNIVIEGSCLTVIADDGWHWWIILAKDKLSKYARLDPCTYNKDDYEEEIEEDPGIEGYHMIDLGILLEEYTSGGYEIMDLNDVLEAYKIDNEDVVAYRMVENESTGWWLKYPQHANEPWEPDTSSSQNHLSRFIWLAAIIGLSKEAGMSSEVIARLSHKNIHPSRRSSVDWAIDEVDILTNETIKIALEKIIREFRNDDEDKFNIELLEGMSNSEEDSIVKSCLGYITQPKIDQLLPLWPCISPFIIDLVNEQYPDYVEEIVDSFQLDSKSDDFNLDLSKYSKFPHELKQSLVKLFLIGYASIKPG